jgi:hypothetical protein
MNRAEENTKLIIEALLPAKLVYRTEQSHGEYDFDLKYQDGRLAALEVTASIDRAELELLAAIKRQTKGRAGLSTTKCRHSWMISVRSSARVNILRQKLETYLSALEMNGISNFSLNDLHIPEVNEICAALEVDHGTVITTSTPPAIYLTPSSGGGFIDPLSAVEAGRREAWKKDNRKKLGGSTASERHLAVYIDLFDDSAWTALHWSNPPATTPDLPAEINHLWLLAEGESPGEFTIWRGRSDTVWQSQRLRLPSVISERER